MLGSGPRPLKQNAAETPQLTAVLLLVAALLIGGPAPAASPAYTIAARFRTGYRPEISIRVNGAGPFWCTLDSGAGGGFLLDSSIGETIGLRGTKRERSFGEGLDSVMNEIVPDTALQVDKLLLPRQSIRLRSSLGEACIFGTNLLDRFVVEIDYLTPEIRLFAAGGYSPPARAIKLPLMMDGSSRPMVAAQLLLQPPNAARADVLLDTAVADQVLSLSKAFSDEHQILQRVSKVITPPFKAESTGKIDLLATRIARLSLGPVRLDNPVVMLFRTPTAARGRLPDGLLGSGFLHRFLVTIDVPGANLYLTPNPAYNDPAPQWWWSAALPLLPKAR
jgi:hypothetical protein